MTRWLAFVAVLAWSGTVGAAPQVRQYSGDMEVEAQGQRMTMRLYVDIGKTRTEMELPALAADQAPVQMVTIARIDERRVYLLYPSDRMYEEKPLDQMDAQLAATTGMQDSAPPVSTETVDGQVCDKYETTASGSTVWVWTTHDQGLPVKLMPADGSSVVRFRNIRPGPQPASLFEVPAGYTRGSPMQGMMQGLVPDGGGMPEGLSEALNEMRKATGQ